MEAGREGGGIKLRDVEFQRGGTGKGQVGTIVAGVAVWEGRFIRVCCSVVSTSLASLFQGCLWIF